jgi:hypothetical protein
MQAIVLGALALDVILEFKVFWFITLPEFG